MKPRKDTDPTFWDMLQSRGNSTTPGEDIANSIVLIVIIALVCFLIFS